MIAIDLKTELELKLERAKQGYERLEPGQHPFTFPERSLVREEVFVARTEAPGECHPRKGGGRRRSIPGEPLQVVDSAKKQRCRSERS